MRNIDLEIELVKGDSNPKIEFTCVNFDNDAVNLTDKTVDFFVRRANSSSHTNSSTTCSVTDAPNGKVEYQVNGDDFPDTGTYFGDLVITDSGRSETSPQAVRMIVRDSNQ